MESEEKSQLERELNSAILKRKISIAKEIASLQKVKWSFRDIMIVFHCGTTTAEKKISAVRALNGAVPEEHGHVFSDVVIEYVSGGHSSRQQEIDNRIAELRGERPVPKKEDLA